MKRLLRSFLAIFVFSLLGLTPTSAENGRDRDRAGEAHVAPSAQVLRPPLLPDDQPIGNPMSGFYADNLVQSQFAAPLSTQSFERFEHIYWSCLENHGAFDFSLIDKVLAGLAPGVRFAFRVNGFFPTTVEANLPGCHLPNLVPDDLETSEHGFTLPFDPSDPTQGSYFVPDWNDPVVLQRMRLLLSALGQRYDGDPRLAWVDIGLYGSWGEWHTQGLPHYPAGVPYKPTDLGFGFNTRQLQPGTPASKEFIVDAHVDAFPTTQLVMMTDDGDALCHALRKDPQSHIGLRRDSLGSGSNSWFFQFPDHLPGCDSPDDVAMILDRWQVAPFVTETFGSRPSWASFMCSNATVQEFCIDQEVPQFHIATVKNSGLGNNADGSPIPWTGLTPAQQQAYLSAGYQAGYRFAPETVQIGEQSQPVVLGAYRFHRHTLSVQTSWINTGITPAYNRWRVEFSLWKQRDDGSVQRASLIRRSQIDLRNVLPTTDAPFVFGDEFMLPRGLEPGGYELRIKVIDPGAYLSPMNLALQDQAPDGSYALGRVFVSGAGDEDRD
jgi:hypothetical protein